VTCHMKADIRGLIMLAYSFYIRWLFKYVILEIFGMPKMPILVPCFAHGVR